MPNLPSEYVHFSPETAPRSQAAGATPMHLQREIVLEELPAIAWRWKGRLLAIFLAATAGSLLWYNFGPKHWRAPADVSFIQREQVSYSADQSYSAPIVETVDTQMAMLQSSEMADRTINWLQNEAVSRGLPASSVTLAAGKFGSSLSVTNPKDTNLIELSVDAKTPTDAVRYSNAVCEAFVAWKQEIAQQKASLSIKNLEGQAQVERTTLTRAEQALRDYEQHAKILDAQASERSAQDGVDQLTLSVAQLRSAAASAVARRDNLSQQLTGINASIKSLGAVRDDALTQQLQVQLHQLEIERVTAAQKYTENYPGVLPGYDAQIAALRRRLTTLIHQTVDKANPSLTERSDVLQRYEQAVSDAIFANAQLASAQQSLNDANTRFSSVPTSSLGFQRLERNVALATASYTAIQSQLTDAMLALSNAGPNVEILQEATTPGGPTSPQPMICLFVVPLLGLVAGLFLAVRSEATANRLRSIEDIRALGIGPVIGALPSNAFNKQLSLVSSVQPSFVAEAYSIARTNLNSFLRQRGLPESRSHTILVTSARTGEGKSVTAAELALSYVRAGKRVTLIDANLRSPTIHELMEIEASPGLTDVLCGKAMLEYAIVTSDEMPNFSLLTAGSPTEAPADVISMPMLRSILMELKHESEVIIIDTASCETADALALAPLVDCTVLVADFSNADYHTLAQTAIAITSQGAPYLAVMANNYDKKASKAFLFGAAHPALPNPALLALTGSNLSQQGKLPSRVLEPKIQAVGEGIRPVSHEGYQFGFAKSEGIGGDERIDPIAKSDPPGNGLHFPTNGNGMH